MRDQGCDWTVLMLLIDFSCIEVLPSKWAS